MKIDFRPAFMKDFDECWRVINEAREQMIESGRHQWTEDYPSKQCILDDINNGNAYVLTVDDKIAVYGAVMLNGEPTYDMLQGEWITHGNYYVIHRFATLPNCRERDMRASSSTRCVACVRWNTCQASRWTPTTIICP